MMSAQQITQRLNEAVAHHKAGRLDRAEAIYRQVAGVAPRTAIVFDLWGQLLEQQGRTEEAAKLFLQAYRLDEKVFSVNVRLSQALVSLGRAADAEKVLRRYVDRNPKSPEGWNALGFVLKVLGRMVEALQCHEKAVTLNPKFVEGWVHYGLTLGVVGQSFRALKQYEHALTLDPKHAPARYGRAETLHKLYRLEEALAEYDAYLKLVPGNHEARSYRLFAMQNADWISREQLFAEHREYGKGVGAGPASLPEHNLDPDKRLRLAILSPDLRTHSCAYFLEPLLQHLDPAEFEVYLYHDHFREDEMSARLKQWAAVWRNFVGQSQAVVERTIRADRPDILVDLTGHIGVTIRLPIIARRLAPVQVTYLGYPDTTGVPAMDFRFTDSVADPEGEADAFATEKLVRFAPTAWAYQPPAEAPEAVPPPCTTKDTVTFGCFNSPTKFSPSLLTAWARLLERVPSGRLLLKGRDFEEQEIRDHILAWMQRCGIPLDRVELLPRTAGTAEHLARYADVDIALDTFPYTGTTTTCEALWMGRPVVTLRGNRHAARVGASLLTAIERPQWIAESADEYVRIAASLAEDRDALAGISTQLRDVLRKSPLLDHAGQSARFAAALRQCWQTQVGHAAPALSR